MSLKLQLIEINELMFLNLIVLKMEQGGIFLRTSVNFVNL